MTPPITCVSPHGFGKAVSTATPRGLVPVPVAVVAQVTSTVVGTLDRVCMDAAVAFVAAAYAAVGLELPALAPREYHRVSLIRQCWPIYRARRVVT